MGTCWRRSSNRQGETTRRPTSSELDSTHISPSNMLSIQKIAVLFAGLVASVALLSTQVQAAQTPKITHKVSPSLLSLLPSSSSSLPLADILSTPLSVCRSSSTLSTEASPSVVSSSVSTEKCQSIYLELEPTLPPSILPSISSLARSYDAYHPPHASRDGAQFLFYTLSRHLVSSCSLELIIFSPSPSLRQRAQDCRELRVPR